MQVSFENLGTVNKNAVRIGRVEIIFSYNTPVAFKAGWGEWVVRKNEWSTTTGKLLNEYQPNKSLRISGSEFQEQLNQVLENNLTSNIDK